MAVSVGYLLIAAGVCGCAPLFKWVSHALSRFFSVVGFFVGIVCVIVAAEVALGLTFLTNIFSVPSATGLNSAGLYLAYFLPVMGVVGILLVSRPIRNIRWGSLIGLGVGLLISAYLKTLVPSIDTTILVVVFIIATLAIYTLLRFVEDLFEFVGTVLAFPPVAIAIGFAGLYFGILITVKFS
ncbi:hypothetical protein AUG19_09040 [archaeon 13_1_20CM_2_54_9]|nr:MAG: hypothetical protein AUJ07_12015 [Crenarchaeota archaeon 13_1_40CM_3_53_5]OLE74257.1 MAG: hypothetical protein AUG19_09040 [archaeon 13_1_20CM_2_54_9]TMI24989.1 MAG: hypothetical protein E6H36_07495 [Candidatus Bathyarchaeota archaeon]TMI31559.1 MAG: hypothetical protein E6H29_04955 [Candidatus Bathyarchaeota archaeon]